MNIQKRTCHIVSLLGLLLFVILAVGSIDDSGSSGGSSGSSNSSNSPTPGSAEPKLFLLNWSWHEEYGYAIVEGEVKNISSENLRNVQAVAKFYTVDKKFITSGDALIEYNPILPGQTSPFKVMATHNPAMKTASIDFKELMGGTIPWKGKE